MARKGESVPIKYKLTASGEVRAVRVGRLTGAKAKLAEKPKQRWRFSEARDKFYIPMKYRTKASQQRSTKYDKMACAAGATARGYSARTSCGIPARKWGTSRAHELLALWRHGSMRKFRKNPAHPASLDLVWRPNKGNGKQAIEWGLIDPHQQAVVKTGTASNPGSAVKAAHNAARKHWKKNPILFREGYARGPYVMGDLDPDVVGAKYVDPALVATTRKVKPRRKTQKKAEREYDKYEKQQKKKESAKAALRRAMRGT